MHVDTQRLGVGHQHPNPQPRLEATDEQRVRHVPLGEVPPVQQQRKYVLLGEVPPVQQREGGPVVFR